MFRIMGRGSAGTSASTLRVVERVGDTVKSVGVSIEPFSSHTSSGASSTHHTSKHTHKPRSSLNHLCFSSLASSYTETPVSDTSGLPFGHFSSSECDESEWVTVDEIEDGGRYGFSGGYVFGQVPSGDEVQDAVFALQQVFGSDINDQVSSDGSEQDWLEPSLSYKSGLLQPHGADSVYHAFYLLQTDPSIQRMVKSLSSDKAVWEAVLNNEVVRKLRESYSAGDKQVSGSLDNTSKNGPPSAVNIVMWIFDSAKTKFTEMIEKVTKIVNELFQPGEDKLAIDATSHSLLNEKIRTCFMLSVMVMLVVLVSRSLRA